MNDFEIIAVSEARYPDHYFFMPMHEKAYLWSIAPKKLSRRFVWDKISRVADSFYIDKDLANVIKEDIEEAGFTWAMKEVSDWRKKEIVAEVLNHSFCVDGVCKWKCEKCGIEWDEPEDKTFDRTQDKTNWPVLCDECWKDVRK